LSSGNVEFQFLGALFGSLGISFHQATTLDEADFLLTVTGATVLLCVPLFLDGAWIDCLQMASHSHPSVSVVVVAEEDEEAMVGSALRRGATAVFWRPIRVSQLFTLMEQWHEQALERARAA
jgi:response regulator of citrate/malate metabolism